jgi:pimeloyl-ACP methyl ester carboxylesterase
MPLSTVKKVGSGFGLGLPLGWFVAQTAWWAARLARIDPAASLAQHANRAAPGFRLLAERETEHYAMRHTIEDGIERILYTPQRRRHATPILMQHGMFHGAWTWQWWQPLLAEWGWESVAVSLPGHGASPAQRQIELCTLDYYLGFLKAEVERLEQPPRRTLPPVLMGHSMGGALTQWYLKYCGDLPAAVLVAPWVSHSTVQDGLPRILSVDPLVGVLTSLAWSATPWIRSPERAARLFITAGAAISPEELHDRLGPESALVVLQHNPPFWSPPDDVRTPLLWLTGEKDATISVPGAARSAEFYQAEHVIVPRAGHNLMMEASYRETARAIAEWLEKLELP